MKSDASIGEAYKSISAKQTRKPFVFVKKSLKKKSSSEQPPSDESVKPQNKTLLDIVV